MRWLSGGDGFEIAEEELFSVVLEIEEHDAIAELGVASDDASANMDGAVVEPESGLNVSAQDQRFDQVHVAAAATEIGRFHVEGRSGAFLAKINWDLDGITRMQPTIGFNGRRAQIRFVGEIHGISFQQRCGTLIMIIGGWAGEIRFWALGFRLSALGACPPNAQSRKPKAAPLVHYAIPTMTLSCTC